jgi:hypothetical protein
MAFRPVLASNVEEAILIAKRFDSNDNSQLGAPTTAPVSIGNIANTSLDVTNNKLVHSCDFANDLKKNIGLKKFLKAIAKWIREGIRAIMRALGFSDPSGSFSEVINMLKSVANYINYINEEFIQPIIEFEKYVLAVLVKIRAIIQWILSLPKKYLEMLRDCLGNLLSVLGDIFSEVWADSAKQTFTEGIETFPDGSSIQTFKDGSLQITDIDGNTTLTGAPTDTNISPSDTGKSYTELAGAIKDVATATKNALTASATVVGLAVNIAVSATVGLLVPTTQDEVTRANATITAYTGSVPAGLEVPSGPSQKTTTP